MEVKLREQGTSRKGSGPEHGGYFFSKSHEILLRGAVWGKDVSG